MTVAPAQMETESRLAWLTPPPVKKAEYIRLYHVFRKQVPNNSIDEVDALVFINERTGPDNFLKMMAVAEEANKRVHEQFQIFDLRPEDDRNR